MNRREMLKALALAGTGTVCGGSLHAQEDGARAGRNRLFGYLESLARDDGGYAWEGQDQSHLTSTFFVIGSYRLLKTLPPRRVQLAEFVRTHHPAALKKLEQERRIFDWQQIQALVWLGEDVAAVKEKILSCRQPLAYLKQYEQNGYPIFSSEMGVILSRALLGVPANELPAAFTVYLDSRRRANGSFNNTPANDGSDGHVLSTWWGLQALRTLKRDVTPREDTVAWLRACQLSNGGFTFAPKPEFGGVDDVAYTWAAVRALHAFRSEPSDKSGCIDYIHSLANADGGFADRPGWLSSPMATYYALDALEALGDLRSLEESKPRAKPANASFPPGLKVFSIQLEAHGRGSPAEAVELARALRIHLWGAKNAKPNWMARAQALADSQRVPVKFFVANEEYGTWVNIPGLGTYSHTSDIIAPTGVEIGESLAKQEAVSWPAFRKDRLAPLEKGGGRLIWQFGENEELVRMFLDDSVARGGYAAISTYHFGNPDFTNTEPFLHRWRGQVPFVALQDAHGPEPWWFADMTTGFRTVFLALEPTWEGWLQALRKGWVAAIRRDRWTTGKTWMHAGSNEVLEYVRRQKSAWQWWDNPDVQRPLVSLVVVRPDDEFEAGRPEQGVTIRVRCAWENTPQGLLKAPISELLKFTLDGKSVAPTLVSKKRPNGLLDDHYHALHLSNPAGGNHVAIATIRVLETKSESERRLEFTI